MRILDSSGNFVDYDFSAPIERAIAITEADGTIRETTVLVTPDDSLFGFALAELAADNDWTITHD